MSDLLTIQDLWVEYETDEGVFKAVNGIDLTIKPGESLGLVGETGAGKTTLALSIMGLLPKGIGRVTRGKAIFDGTDLMQLGEAGLRRLRGSRISMVFQDPMTSLNPVLPVGEQISEVLHLHHPEMSKSELEKRTREILEMVGISSDRCTDYPHQFSGGMKQRIIIAIAIACQPDLLLADEPTTALDVTIQAQVLAMMNELREKLNTAIILITHDLGVVAQMCEKVAIIYAGEIIEYGTLTDVFDHPPHHPYTQGLFASIPSLDSKSERLSVIGGLMPDADNLPDGCRFHPRCRQCMDVCKKEKPAPVMLDGHMIRCHLLNRHDG